MATPYAQSQEDRQVPLIPYSVPRTQHSEASAARGLHEQMFVDAWERRPRHMTTQYAPAAYPASVNDPFYRPSGRARAISNPNQGRATGRAAARETSRHTAMTIAGLRAASGSQSPPPA
eukprot:4778126-Amphidinium_carterae.1